MFLKSLTVWIKLYSLKQWDPYSITGTLLNFFQSIFSKHAFGSYLRGEAS